MQNKFPKVSIILLNYNGYNDTIECFKSLQQITYPNYNIVIVDNNSPDNSIEDINSYMKDNKIESIYFSNLEDSKISSSKDYVTLIQSGFNGGYGEGNNIGIKYALKNEAEYILVLNNDTIVEKDFLEPLVNELINDKNIGIISSQIFYEDRREVFWENGGEFNTLTGRVSHNNFNEKFDINKDYKSDCTFLSGCLWLIPKRIFEKVGYINEEYFMYVEDLEFCQRVINNSYKLKVSSKSKIYHKVGGSSGGEISSFSIYWMTKNYLKFMLNNTNILIWPLFIFNNVIRFSIRFIYLKKFELIKKQFKAILDLRKVNK